MLKPPGRWVSSTNPKMWIFICAMYVVTHDPPHPHPHPILKDAQFTHKWNRQPPTPSIWGWSNAISGWSRFSDVIPTLAVYITRFALSIMAQWPFASKNGRPGLAISFCLKMFLGVFLSQANGSEILRWFGSMALISSEVSSHFAAFWVFNCLYPLVMSK